MSPTERRSKSAAATKDWIGTLLRSYAPLPGVWDEMMRPDGQLRPPWDGFIDRVATLGAGPLREAFDGVTRHLRQSGVFFRAYDDPVGGERPWPLTPVPLLIGPDDWRVLSAGAIQRARLAEALLADVYGEGRIVRDGVLPAAVIAGSPNYLRPLVGVALFAAAYMAEVVRGGLQAMPKGQYEGAMSLGLGYWQMMRLIILPQALRIVIPGIVNTFIGLFKDTTLVTIVGIFDFLRTIEATLIDPTWATPTTRSTGYAFAAIFYFLCCWGMSRYSIAVEKRLAAGQKR